MPRQQSSKGGVLAMEDVEGISDDVLFPHTPRHGHPAAIRPEHRIHDISDNVSGPHGYIFEEETPMPNVPRFSKAEITSLALQLEQARKYVAQLEEKYIAEPVGNGAVIRFALTFGPRVLDAFPPGTRNPQPNPTTFMYAGIRAQDKWYLTGENSPQALDWLELLAWIDDKAASVSEIEVWDGHRTIELNATATAEND
jgi:hypothetical protein